MESRRCAALYSLALPFVIRAGDIYQRAFVPEGFQYGFIKYILAINGNGESGGTYDGKL
jgi:hypothetical protein